MPRRRRTTESRAINPDHLRVVLREEAARIMVEENIRDFQIAKQKARERLGLSPRQGPLPSNKEIDQAMGNRLRLFDQDAWERELSRLRRIAGEAMQFLNSFEPRLVGALVRGHVTSETPIEIHLFPDTPEDVVWHLDRKNIIYELFEKRVRYPRDRYRGIPGFRYVTGDAAIELLAFHRKELSAAPLCPVDGKPMRRLALKAVRQWADGRY